MLQNRIYLRYRIPIFGLIGAVVLYTLIGFIILPIVAKSVLIDQLSDRLKRQVSIKSVQANPYNLSMTIQGLEIKDRDGERFASFNELFVNLQAASLFRKAVVIHRLRLANPDLRIVRTEEQEFNFSDLITEPATEKRGDAILPGFQIRNIAITDGQLLFEDRVKKRRHEMAGLQLSLPALSSLPVDEVIESRPDLTARLNGASFTISGSARPFADNRWVELKIGIRRFDLVPLLTYLPVKLKAGIQSAILQTDTTIRYIENENGKPQVTLSGPVTLNDLKIIDADGHRLVDLPKFTVNPAPSDLLSGKVHLRSVTLRSLGMFIKRDRNGRLNLLDLKPPEAESAKTAAVGGEPAPPVDLEVDSVRVETSSLMFSDPFAGGGFQTTLSPIHLSMDNFHLDGATPATYALSVQTEAGEGVDLSGNFTIQPFNAEGRIELTQWRPDKYAPYYQDRINFQITGGTLDVASAFHIEAAKPEPKVLVENASIRMHALKLVDKITQKPVVSVPLMEATGLEVDTSERRVKLAHFFSEKGGVTYHKSKEGRVNLLHLLAPPPPSQNNDRAESPAAPSPPSQWQVAAEKIRIRDYRIQYEDLQMPEPVRLNLDGIDVEASPFTTAAGQKSTISAGTRWNEKGKIFVEGSVTVDPVAADLAVTIGNVDIRSFQPYVSQYLNAVVTGGDVNCNGKVSFHSDPQGKPSFTYSGDAAIVRFATVDKVDSHDFVKWDALHLTRMTAGLNPNRFLAEEMALSKYHTRIIILPDGTVNANRVLAGKKSNSPQASSEPAEAEAGGHRPPGAKIAIRQITIDDSTLKFTDLLNKPNFEANIQKLGGHISGLSSEKGAMAEVSLKGVNENTAPMEITGRFHPFGEDRNVEMNLLFSDIELSPFSAYSGKYIGYLLEKGKLHLNLEYRMQGNKLDAKNLIVLDQLTLGEKVESPDATSLPVAFAISLLKDRSGKIEIDLPVSGDVKDPKFKIGKIILRMIVNLFTKIITSPFAALGAVFGGGEQLSHVDFNLGKTDISEAGMKKLDTLVNALYERPALQLEIKEESHPIKDGKALRQTRYIDVLKGEKLKQMTQTGQQAVPLAQIEITESEQDQLAALAYQAADFPKPRGPSGKEKTLPPEEMMELILTHIRITDDDLRLLAHERASRVKDYLLQSEKLNPAKVFVLEPDSDFSESSKTNQNSRVNFSLK